MRYRLLLLFTLVFAPPGSPAVMARTVSIVAGPDLAAPAQHGLAKFEAAARARGWGIDRAASVEVARGE